MELIDQTNYYSNAVKLYKDKIILIISSTIQIRDFEGRLLLIDSNFQNLDLCNKISYLDLDTLKYKYYKYISIYIKDIPTICEKHIYKVRSKTFFLYQSNLYSFFQGIYALAASNVHILCHTNDLLIYDINSMFPVTTVLTETKVFNPIYNKRHIYLNSAFAVNNRTIYFDSTTNIKYEFEIEGIKFVGRNYSIKKRVTDNLYLVSHSIFCEKMDLKDIQHDKVIIKDISDASFHNGYFYILKNGIVYKYTSKILKISIFKDIQFYFI